MQNPKSDNLMINYLFYWDTIQKSFLDVPKKSISK